MFYLKKILLCISFYNFSLAASLTNKTSLPERFYQLVIQNGYKAESYSVITEDDYILRLDRISGAPSSPEAEGKPVVFLQHGFLGCSELFVFWDPKDSLAYLLADAGYDVWVSNIRGNTNSRAHRTISPKDRKFWNFTLDDVATKDLSAMIDFTLNKTKQPCLTYIGHSMGTTLSYILLSERPEYNNKISFVVSLAPIALWRYSTLGLLKSILNSVIDILNISIGAPDYAIELLAHDSNMKRIFENFCNIGGSTLCVFLVNSFFGHSHRQEFTPNQMKHITDYIVAGTSLKLLQHYRQMMNSGVFRKFNYGSTGNLRIYGREKPPMYTLKAIKSKVALIWVHNDELGHEMNVGLLAQRLRNLVTMEPVPSLEFRHSDFYFFRNGKHVIHDRIIRLVENHHKCVFNNGTKKRRGQKYSPRDIFFTLKYSN